ncbi:hypothetical protein AB0D33_06140 [Streptomyces sp. NPDC048404]|uniref:hypothetical protein n=1 Tax=unclassified Streptomyces TaxID=2593676 RepID=UPI00343697AB
MNSSPTQPGVTALWLLVAVLFSLVVALVASLLKIKDGATATTVITSAAVAFAGTTALLLPTFNTVGLL